MGRVGKVLAERENAGLAPPEGEQYRDRLGRLNRESEVLRTLDLAFKVPATKVNGCASQVWLVPHTDGGQFRFDGDSDAMIVRGLIAVLAALYNGLPLPQVGQVDAVAELGRLGLNDHLSAQRSNGVRAMVERIRAVAAVGPTA